MTSRTLAVLVAGAVAAGGALAATSAGAADHLDAPAVQADGRTDINDLYAFASPSRPDRTVLAMTVNPGAGTISGTTFDPRAAYSFKIDDDGDAVADHEVTVRFTRPRRWGQFYFVKIDHRLVSIGKVGRPSKVFGGGKVVAGVFDDPFFFDLEGFNDGLAFTGDDFFAGLNVSAIVVELPTSLSSSDQIGVWATTSTRGKQIDRIGRPAINTVLIPSDRKDEFNRAEPVDDLQRFGDDVNAAIAGLSDQANADALTPILLPDILTIDLTSTDGFLNGRQLADDVIDAELGLLTTGAVSGDGVDGNDVPFRSEFPYLAPANR